MTDQYDDEDERIDAKNAWRQHPFTQALVKALQKRRAKHMQAIEGGLAQPETAMGPLKMNKGAIDAIDQTIKYIEA